MEAERRHDGEDARASQEAAESLGPLPLPPTLSRPTRRRVLRATLLLVDAATLLLATLSATLLRFKYLTVGASFENVELTVTYSEVSIWVTAIWLVALAWERLYDLDRIFRGAAEFSRVVRALSIGLVGFILLTYVLKMPGLSRLWTVLAWLLGVLFVIAGRLCIRAWLAYARRRGHMLRPTLIVGSNTEAEDLIRVLSADSSTGIRPIGCLASSQAEKLALNYCQELPCLGAAREVVDVVTRHHIDSVIIASSAFDHDVLARMIAELRGVDCNVHVSSGLFEVLTSRVLVREISGVPLITVKGVALTRMNLFVKRAFDLVFASLVCVVGMPLWILLAVLVKVTSRGPVLYRQERIGKDGRPFGMLKFRSMYSDAEDRLRELAAANEASGPLFKMRDDPRVTPVGKWMRRLSLDEFPQFLNVLAGQMSVVGPRPPLPREAAEYSDAHWRRLQVVPGMTGLWQVSGRSNLTFDEMVRLDLFYIENWSVTLDLALILRTLPAVLVARGAY